MLEASPVPPELYMMVCVSDVDVRVIGLLGPPLPGPPAPAPSLPPLELPLFVIAVGVMRGPAGVEAGPLLPAPPAPPPLTPVAAV